MKFHLYITELRKKRFNSITKLSKLLNIDYQVWRKIERGINPPPRKILLSKFCNLVLTKEYEKSQLFELARRWEPHPHTNTTKHNLYHEGLETSWVQAVIKENTPDYEHKYWGKRN